MSDYEETRKLAKQVVFSIDAGLFDHYLKAIADSVVARRDTFDTVPMQLRLAKTPKDALMAALVDDANDTSTEDDDEPDGTKAFKAASKALSVPPGDPAPVPKAPRRKPQLKATVVGNVTDDAFKGVLSPLPLGTVVDHSFVIDGYTYDRADIMRKVLDVGPRFGLSDLRVRVIGVGPKALKVVLLTEPPRSFRLDARQDVHEAWRTNEAVYMPPETLRPWLLKPAAGSEHLYKATK